MTAVVDIRIPKSAENALCDRGFSVIKMPPHPHLPRPVASHPDMLVFFAHDAIFTTPAYTKIAPNELSFLSEAAQRPIRTTSQEVGERYPLDILLNAAPLGECLLCHSDRTAWELTERYKEISVRQGYAKCATLPVGERAIVTEDASVTRAAEQNGIEVLRVESNAVCLHGYDTGFLGGAASFAPYGGVREIYFCGDLDTHPNAWEIQAFCKRHGFEAISLSAEPLTDVGTIFLI